MENTILQAIFVQVRLLMYPIASLILLMLAFSGKNWRKTKSYPLHLAFCILFMILETALLLRVLQYPTETIRLITDYGFTGILVIIIFAGCRQLVRQEKDTVKKANGHKIEIEEKNGTAKDFTM